MTDYEKIRRACRDLEDIRADLSQRLMQDAAGEDGAGADLKLLHERLSKAIRALSGQG